MYIHEHSDWPQWKWDEDLVQIHLSRVIYFQGNLTGRLMSLGLAHLDDAQLANLTEDAIQTSAIEGEVLNTEQVRSSIARKLGLDMVGLVPSGRSVDGLVNILLDATLNYQDVLSTQRLFHWHKELFPIGRSGFTSISVGSWRDDQNGPMQVVSGPIARERVHYQAPQANGIPLAMEQFLLWFNQDSSAHLILKAGIAHLWFVTLHPFDDGNGRIARALTDMLLARSDHHKKRFYSLSSSIKDHRKAYYDILEKTQKGNMDITSWLVWFLNCVELAIQKSLHAMDSSVKREAFWQQNRLIDLNKRQVHMLNLLVSGLGANLTSSKWAQINHCSQDTAYRDILDLISKEILEKSQDGGRTTHYTLKNRAD